MIKNEKVRRRQPADLAEKCFGGNDLSIAYPPPQFKTSAAPNAPLTGAKISTDVENLIQQAEERMDRATVAGDDPAWVDHFRIWLELLPLHPAWPGRGQR